MAVTTVEGDRVTTRTRRTGIALLNGTALLLAGCSGQHQTAPTTDELATVNTVGTAISPQPSATTPSPSPAGTSGTHGSNTGIASTTRPTVTVSSAVTSGLPSSSSSTGSADSTATASTNSVRPTSSATYPPANSGSTAPTSTSRGQPISSREAADRKAAERGWLDWWAVYGELANTPPSKQLPLIQSVAVEPLVSSMVQAFTRAQS